VTASIPVAWNENDDVDKPGAGGVSGVLESHARQAAQKATSAGVASEPPIR
jgi:hypothetical protein